MPKDYTQAGADTTAAAQKDYTTIGRNNPAIGKDYTGLPTPGPNVQKLFNDTQLFLQERGYSDDTINALMAPVGNMTNPMALDTFYRDVKPVFERNIAGVEEALHLSQVLEEELGIKPTFKEQTALITTMERFSKESLSWGGGMLSNAHRWWIKAKRAAGDKAASEFSGTMLNIDLGMALLDTVDNVDKWFKFQALKLPSVTIAGKKTWLKQVPKQELHDIANRTMPKIILEGPEGSREFSTSTSASLWVLGNRIHGMGEQSVAKWLDRSTKLPRMAWDKLTGSEPLDEFFDNLRDRGEERENMALGQIPPLVSALGIPSTKLGGGLTWIEIAERKLGAEQSVDDMYAWMDSKGKMGEYTMFGAAWIGGLADITLVPTTVAAGIVEQIPKVAVQVARGSVKGRGSLAKLASERAHSTKRLDDIFEAVRDAQSHVDDIKLRYDADIKERIRATGKPKVSGPLWRRYMAAERQLNDNKSLRSLMDDPTDGELLMEMPRRNPRLLMPPADDASVASKEIHKYRKQYLETGPSFSPKWRDSDLPGFQQRKAFGPDDTEVAGEGMEAMVKTGGEAIDDITIPLQMTPEYAVTPARGPIDFIDWSKVPLAKARAKAEQRFIDSISGKGLPEFPGQPKFADRSLRMLIQEEDVIRRNLGSARSLKNKKLIKLHEQNLKEIRTVMDRVKATGIGKNNQQYDDVFFPAEQPTIMGNAERFNHWVDLAGDRVLRGLYPGSLLINMSAGKGSSLFATTRYDPMRYYQVMDPGAWDEIRMFQLREQQSNVAWVSKMREIFVKAGVVKPLKGKLNLKRITHDYEVDKEKSRILYDYLNTKPSDPEFHHLREVLPKEIVEAHDKIREVLETAKDWQGIRGDDYLEGYVHHMFPKSLLDEGGRFPEGMGMSRNTELMASHLMKRRGNAGYERDVVASIDLYGRMMQRKMYREPMFDFIRRTGDDLTGKTGNAIHRYYADSFVRQLDGKPGFLGEAVDAVVGSFVKAGGRSWKPGTIERKLMGLSGLVHMSMLGGNPRYAFMQLSNAIVTTQSRYGMLRTLKGLFKMGTKEGQALAKEAGIYQSYIDILESPDFKSLSTFIFEKWPAITPFGVMTNAKAEMMARGMTMFAAIDEHLAKAGFSTIDEAMEAGKWRSIVYSGLRSSEEVNHLFGAAGRNPILTRVTSQGFSTAVSQFLSFIPKQTDELLFQAMREPGSLARYLMISGWASKIAAEDLGTDITEYVGLGYLPKEGGDIASPGMDFMINLVEYANAHNSHNPARVSRAAQKLLDSATNIIPAKVQATSLTKAANRLMTKEIKKSTGEKLMDLDFAGKSGLEAVRPTEGGPVDAPGLGGQLLPTIFMQKDIKERLVRRSLQAGRREDQRFAHNLRVVLDGYANAVDDGDVEAQEKWIERLKDESGDKIRLVSGAPISRAMEARHISEVLRYWHPKFGADKKLMDIRLETLRRFGINPAPAPQPAQEEQ